MSSIIRVNSIYRHHQSGSSVIKAVDGVSFTVEEGEFIAVTGPSGSGKSTLLSLIAGLDRADRGEIWIGDLPLHDLDEGKRALFRRKEVGFIFQSFQLFDNYTALENVQFPLELDSSSDRASIRNQAMGLLKRVGLAARHDHYPQQLSGGEQQRVAIARAFAARPRLLLADEPTGNLDCETGTLVIEAVMDLKDSTGCTVVMVTHDLEVAQRADRILSMHNGQLVEQPGSQQ